MAFPRPAAAGRGYCDTYFVETDEDSLFAIRAVGRERALAMKQQRQRVLAEQLSGETSDEYAMDILNHLERMEAETMADVNSIDIQTEIQWFMRPYLLDFLMEAHHAFRLLPETLFLAVNLLDRYCSKRVVYKRHYQLVGCAALLIAAKYGDLKENVPAIKELKTMCCALYEEDMFTQMEWHVLQTLGWVVGHPTVTSFLQLAWADAPYDPEAEHMAGYLTEIALYYREFVSVQPSVIARSALALARCILNRRAPEQSDWAATYDSVVVMNLSNHLYQPSQVLSRKYASAHLSSVSSTLQEFLRRQAQLNARCAPPTPPTDFTPMSEKPAGKPAGNPFGAPTTPCKGPYQHLMPNGALTPPITPDKDPYSHPPFGAHYGMIQRAPTPLTPALSQEQQVHHQSFPFPPMQTSQ